MNVPLPETIPVGYKLRRVLKKHFNITVPIKKKGINHAKIRIKDSMMFEFRIMKYIRAKGCIMGDYNTATSFFEDMNERIHEILDKATRRAKRNGRKTILPDDL